MRGEGRRRGGSSTFLAKSGEDLLKVGHFYWAIPTHTHNCTPKGSSHCSDRQWAQEERERAMGTRPTHSETPHRPNIAVHVVQDLCDAVCAEDDIDRVATRVCCITKCLCPVSATTQNMSSSKMSPHVRSYVGRVVASQEKQGVL